MHLLKLMLRPYKAAIDLQCRPKMSSGGSSSSSLISSLFHGARSSSTVIPYTSTHPLLRDFEDRLSSQMEKLSQQGQSDQRHCSCLNAKWLRRALDVFLSTHSQAEGVLFPQMLSEGWNCESSSMDWVNRQLEDTVRLLDMCNAVRESVREMKQCAGSLQLAIHCLTRNRYSFFNAGQLVRARNALAKYVEAMANRDSKRNVQRSKLEKCGSMLRWMGELKPAGSSAKGHTNTNSSSRGNVVEEIMNGWKATAVLVCSALAAAFCTKSKRSTWPVSSVDRSMRCSSLLNVQQKVKEEVDCRRRTKGIRALLQEFDSLDTAVRNLYGLVNGFIACKSIPLGNDQAVQLQQSVQVLEKCTVELEEGLSILEKPVDQMFNALICSRMAMLDILSYS